MSMLCDYVIQIINNFIILYSKRIVFWCVYFDPIILYIYV